MMSESLSDKDRAALEKVSDPKLRAALASLAETLGAKIRPLNKAEKRRIGEEVAREGVMVTRGCPND